MKYKMLNGLCVPETTPNNFFALSEKQWWRRQAEIRSASLALHRQNIASIEARYELESDEFQTSEEKAAMYL